MSEDLERETLLDHARRPRNHGALASATHEGFCENPSCGDQVRVSANISNGRIFDLRVHAQGCAIAVASASLMSEELKGLTVAEANARAQEFEATLKEEGEAAWPISLTRLQPFRFLRRGHLKLRCALIAWSAWTRATSNIDGGNPCAH
ncbi:MAG: Fe-S cluster assembly sulfur transfer protein SufU [Bdellovibrionia bacterium]